MIHIKDREINQQYCYCSVGLAVQRKKLNNVYVMPTANWLKKKEKKKKLIMYKNAVHFKICMCVHGVYIASM